MTIKRNDTLYAFKWRGMQWSSIAEWARYFGLDPIWVRERKNAYRESYEEILETAKTRQKTETRKPLPIDPASIPIGWGWK